MKILQFGTGRFLRGFFAPIVPSPRSITVVQSRPNSSGAAAIESRKGLYHVWNRGIQNGKRVDSFEEVNSIDRALVATRDWSELCSMAVDPNLKLVVSNTTAAGIQLEELDQAKDSLTDCPLSFPAKLTSLLFQRFRKGLPGLTMLPVELIDNNAERLFELVVAQSKLWNSTNQENFHYWLAKENRWLNNLVDRIVVSPTEPPPWEGEDPLAVVAEPFRMLAIQDDGRGQSPVPDHEMVTWTKDLTPYYLRKVRILNGLHTAMVAKFLPLGVATVRECVTNAESRQWIDQLLNDEILPALSANRVDGSEFAVQTMERFENPFMEHKLADIANGHETKLSIRIQPTLDEFVKAFGQAPPKLSEVVATRLPAEV